MSSARGCTARDNPFRTERVLAFRYRLESRELASLLDRFAALHYRASLVGPQGTGKTTLREDIEARMREQGWRICGVRLCREDPRLTAEQRRRIREADAATLVTVDGAEQLGWCAWRWLRRVSRRAGGLLVTLHRERGLPVLHSHRCDFEVVRTMVSALAGHDTAVSLDKDLREMYAVYGGNTRDVLRELYDWWAEGRRGVRGECTDAPNTAAVSHEVGR
ncbi:MAG: hypothetical protein GF331_12450 [Chitinivibrionales bacterium]|nr:hypothetical protein [Chitinivibrionales bacterium]